MLLRANGLIVTLCVASGFFGFIALLLIGAPGPAQGRATFAVAGAVLVATCARLARAGLRLEADEVTIRGLTTTDRLGRAEVLGLAMQPFFFSRLRRLVVVCADGRVVPATWTIAMPSNQEWAAEAARCAAGFGPTQPQVAESLSRSHRLDSVQLLPVATSEPGLTPATVLPALGDQETRGLGWETIFLVTAFALPGLVSAIVLLAEHIGGVSDLNEFDLPLPHDKLASLVLLIVHYSASAVVVPIALLLLYRTGQPPATLGLTKKNWRSDVIGGGGMVVGVFVANVVFLAPFLHVINNKHLTNTGTNSHVPAYFIIYGLFVSAVTAINEEVMVNGYFLTRLSQLGWSPRSAFALSLAVRTSYHVYYGAGIIATIPLGYIVTRSFQKHGRLGRPIVTHFVNDAIIFTIAVLTS